MPLILRLISCRGGKCAACGGHTVAVAVVQVLRCGIGAGPMSAEPSEQRNDSPDRGAVRIRLEVGCCSAFAGIGE